MLLSYSVLCVPPYTMSRLTQVLCFIHFQILSIASTRQVIDGDVKKCARPRGHHHSGVKGFSNASQILYHFVILLEAVILWTIELGQAAGRVIWEARARAWVGEAGASSKGSDLGFLQGPNPVNLTAWGHRDHEARSPTGEGEHLIVPHPRQLKLSGRWWERLGLNLLRELHPWFLEAGSQSIISRGGFQGALPGSAILPLIQRVLLILSLP